MNSFIKTYPGLVLDNCNGVLKLHNPLLIKSWESNLINHDNFANLIIFCYEKKPYLEVKRFLIETTGFCEKQVQAGLEELINANILEILDSTQTISQQENIAYSYFHFPDWKCKNWEDAFYFHLHSNVLEKFDYTENLKGDEYIMKEFLKKDAKPPVYKEYPHASSIDLADLNEEVWQQRNLSKIIMQDIENNDVKSLSFADFSYFVKLAFGQTRFKMCPVMGKLIAKTSPSGGSRHPTEIYVCIINVSNIQPGYYHYNVKKHTLEILSKDNPTKFISKEILTPALNITKIPEVVFIYSTLYERSMHRYRESRTYRVIHLDVGHLMETTKLIARSLGKNHISGLSLKESAVEQKLDLDGISESVIAFSAII